MHIIFVVYLTTLLVVQTAASAFACREVYLAAHAVGPEHNATASSNHGRVATKENLRIVSIISNTCETC